MFKDHTNKSIYTLKCRKIKSEKGEMTLDFSSDEGKGANKNRDNIEEVGIIILETEKTCDEKVVQKNLWRLTRRICIHTKVGGYSGRDLSQ